MDGAKPSGTASQKAEAVEFLDDPLLDVARKHWVNPSKKQKFDPKVVSSIYSDELQGNSRRAEVLEYTGYLEQYLWPHFTESAPREHLLSLVLMTNEKARQGSAMWEPFRGEDDRFTSFFVGVLSLINEEDIETRELGAFITFLINAFQSLEDPLIRQNSLRLVSLPTWLSMNQTRVELEISKYPQLRRHWNAMKASREKKQKSFSEQATPKKKGTKRKGSGAASNNSETSTEQRLFLLEESFLPTLVDRFLCTLENITETTEVRPDQATVLERMVELLIDLVSQLPTRRFSRTFLSERQVVVRARLCGLMKQREGVLFSKLVDDLDRFMHFEIDDHTGLPMSTESMTAQCYSKLQILQRLVFKLFPEKLKDFALTSVGSVATRSRLLGHLNQLETSELEQLVKRLRMDPPSVAHAAPFFPDHSSSEHSGKRRKQAKGTKSNPESKTETGENEEAPRELLLEILLSEHSMRTSEIDSLNGLPLYPDEELLWNPNLVPFGSYRGDRPLALPKLNLQFLTFYDYLLRSFKLFRLEAAYEIRADLVDCIQRMDPRKAMAAGGIKGAVEYTKFLGWARMGVPLEQFEVTRVDKPNIGEEVPSQVKGEIQMDTRPYAEHIQREWDSLREHDVLFLVSIKSPVPLDADRDTFNPLNPEASESKGIELDDVSQEASFPLRYGVVYVRGCEVVSVLDEDNNMLNDPANAPARVMGTKRTIQVKLDPSQYKEDMDRKAETGVDVYETLNVLVRRRGKENNFKAILESIRDVMNVASVGKAVPNWLHDIFLGYGDPAAAHYSNLPGQLRDLDFKDTFVSAQHVRESFPGMEVIFISADGTEVKGEKANSLSPPFRIRFVQQRVEGKGKKASDKVQTKEVAMAIAYNAESKSPFHEAAAPSNPVPFSAAQVEAIRSGMNPGLSLVVGPPGTGKTDVAVQTIANLHHNFPEQRILVITHSNQALNDIFEKIMDRDIDERYLLRLGMGEKGLRSGTNKDFSKYGRVNHCLQRRLDLLAEVERLGTSLKLGSDVGYTCETAVHFNTYHVLPRIEEFRKAMHTLHEPEASAVTEAFPFSGFFEKLCDGQLFKASSFEGNMNTAEGCFKHLDHLFEELQSYRPFELLRTQKLRGDHLITSQAKVVAMTCTHAALTRRKLADLNFKFDSIIMEEAAQALEVETFIPMLLQNLDNVEGSRLKRVMLIGDHNQLPPVVKNQAFQKYGHLDQSLFGRFIRLGVPAVHLDLQGRCRPSIAELFRWRYKELRDVEALQTDEAYSKANAGFAHEYQFVDVQDYAGQGEVQPSPHFYQNLGEAEYVVAVYQFMRLCGYKAEDISILTTYNGQKHLIRDIINQRCAPFPFFGAPAHVTTVDRFQGNQNKFVLLSLVRTKSVGHLRDIRRLIVAVSRAQLGLYIFGRKALFEQCAELQPVMHLLSAKPEQLTLVPGEHFPCERALSKKPKSTHAVKDVTEMGGMVHQMTVAVLPSEQ